MTKEEILKKNLGPNFIAERTTECVLDAMDEYAISILDAASNYKDKDNGGIELIGGNFYLDSDKEGDNPLNGKELYQLFIKQNQ